MRKTALALTTLATLAAGPASAGHELRGFVSLSGVEVLEQAVPTLVPESIDGVEMEKELLACSDTRVITATQRDTTIELELHRLDIELPQDDHLVVDLDLSASGNGELHLDNPYACFGEATCENDFFLRNANIRIDFNMEVENGKPVLTVHDLDLDIAEDDIDITLDGCTGIDTIANVAVDFVTSYLLEQTLGMAENLAVSSLGPGLAEAMVGFNGYQGDFDKYGIDAQMAEIDLSIAGLLVRGTVDVFSDYRPAGCIDSDPGDPASSEGPAPVFDMSASDVGLAANYGLFNDLLYHVWRRGLLCVNEQTLAGYGLDTHHLMEEISHALPGFPVGTEFGIEVRTRKPPRVTGSAAAGGGMTLIVEGLMVDISGHRPDGTSGTFSVELDLSVDARLGVNPEHNVMTMSFGESSIDKLVIDDQIAAAEAGFDAGRIRRVVGDFIMPAMLDEMSGMPLTAPIFGFSGVYVILREAAFDQAFASVALDLFVAPEHDDQAPDTAITEQPSSLTNPRDAVLVFSGSDDQVPVELLQYQVSVDGETAAPSFVRTATIGELGVTRTYQVEVAAVDLNGNVDPTPIVTSLTVDGIAPGLAIAGKRVRMADGPTDIAWTASDDTSEASALDATIEIYRLADRSDPLSKQLVETISVPAGQSSTQISVRSGDLYRVEVVVEDEAGNQSRTSLTLKTPGMGGCSAAGGAPGAPLGLALALLALGFRRQRRAETAV